MLKIKNIVHEVKTEHQHLIIFENESFGRVLALDGAIQLTAEDEFIYSEMMAHVPIAAHGAVESVLIVGGGDGAILREVVKHQTVKSITMVEIDDFVVNLSKRYLPDVSRGAFDDPRFQLFISDAADFIVDAKNRFDVIICDSTDPIGPGASLFTAEFYSNCRAALRERGILVCQSGVPFMQGAELTAISANLRSCFARVDFFVAPIPTYVGGFMAMSFATDCDGHRDDRLDARLLRQRLGEIGASLKYYSPEIQAAAFVLPPYVRKRLVCDDA